MQEKKTEQSNSAIQNQPLTLAAWSILAIALFWVLWLGKALLIPLFLAVLAFYLIDILNDVWRKTIFRRVTPSNLVLNTLSGLVVLVCALVISRLVADNAASVVAAAPRYGTRLAQVYEDIIDQLPIEDPAPLQDMLEQIDFGRYVAFLASGIAGIVGNGALIFLYLVFLMLERPFFTGKLDSLIPDSKKRASAERIILRINRDIRTYLGVKTFVSILTAALAYGIMWYLGLDFAAFWALLIFVFNFIPNIGSLIATALPAALALVQFESFRPFVIVVTGITAIQIVIGNFLEPRLMGRTLNMSPLAVVLSLVFWGMLWGMAGMFLSVPVTAVMAIVFSHFEMTRWIAILMSRAGDLPGREEEPSTAENNS